MRETNAKPVILLAFANDPAHPLPRLADEHRELCGILRNSDVARLCEVQDLPYATVEQIIEVFQDRRFRHRIAIFHYAGHANGFQLLLESPEGKTKLAHAGGLAAFLGQQRGLQLVFLNGCSTEQQVQGLLHNKVPAVIATSQAIDDAVAADFAALFYKGLGNGDNIREAYEEAAAAVRTQRGDDVRHLYMEGAGHDDRWPWQLYPQDYDEARAWRLSEAADDLSTPPKKPLLERWQTWVGLIGGILAIILGLTELRDKYFSANPPSHEEIATTPLGGWVKNSDGEFLANAMIIAEGLQRDTTYTDSFGGFYFAEIPGKINERVRIYIYQQGRLLHNEYVTLPGPAKLVLEE
ncbi:CHAT domain-containing protein [candidate division KSB1 bacterium]|nr:CHAT domain-containing protein [candidate division KSB1 bacterium]